MLKREEARQWAASLLSEIYWVVMLPLVNAFVIV